MPDYQTSPNDNFNYPPRPAAAGGFDSPPAPAGGGAGRAAEDIFAPMESPAPAAQQPSGFNQGFSRGYGTPPPVAAYQAPGQTAPSGDNFDQLNVRAAHGGNLKYLLIGLFTLAVVLAGGWLVYQIILKPQLQVTPENLATPAAEQPAVLAPLAESAATDLTAATTSPAEETVATTTPTEVPVAPGIVQDLTAPLTVDSDGDGLLDTEEEKIGTDKLAVDSDSDGLTDKEEIKTYNTDPLNPDTDGDSYQDGAEVKNGYNPNGPGRLLIVK